MHQNTPKLSVVILCYRAGSEILDFVSDTKKILKKNGINDYELVLVGNYHEGSKDPTPGIVKRIALKDPRVAYVAEIKKGMMGWDMKSGLDKAAGKYIAVIDGDGQMPINDLVLVYKEITSNDYDLVKTYRITRGDGIKRKTLSFFYNLFFCLLFPGLRSRDINSKPKILTREAYQKLGLESTDWFIDAEIMIQARRYKFNIKELPTEFFGLGGKRKSFVGLKAIFEFIKNMIVYRIKEFGK